MVEWPPMCDDQPPDDQPMAMGTCLTARPGTRPLSCDDQIIVFGHGSSHDCVACLDAYAEHVEVVTQPVHVGFTAARNARASRASGADFLVFPTSDMLPIDGWLDALVTTLDRHHAAAAAGATRWSITSSRRRSQAAAC